MNTDRLTLDGLKAKLGELAGDIREEFGAFAATAKRERIFELATLLKGDASLQFSMLLDVTVVDWMDAREDRFEVVYHFLSMARSARLRVNVALGEDAPSIASLCPLYASANFAEREAWDMYGVVFENHPDLRRILMYDEFVGYPLRKDYPVQAKQPRIPMRSPEVRNTAIDMKRPALTQGGLVQINAGASSRSGASKTEAAGKISG